MNRQEYLGLVLMEECAEVAQAMSKVLRFGLMDLHNGMSNQARLVAELNDLIAVIEMLHDEGVMPPEWWDQDAVDAKIAKVNLFEGAR